MTFRTDFEHRADLIEAALAEFTEHGYDSASLNQTLGAAGMSKGQLYHHFDGKEALYLALVEWMIDEKTAWLAGRPRDEEAHDFFDLVAANIRSSLAFSRARPEVGRFTGALLAERGKPIFVTVTERFGFSSDGGMGELVAQHHAKGEFRSELSPRFVSSVVALVIKNLPDLLDLYAPGDLAPQVDHLESWLRHSLGPP